jgi:hypothetical protein
VLMRFFRRWSRSGLRLSNDAVHHYRNRRGGNAFVLCAMLPTRERTRRPRSWYSRNLRVELAELDVRDQAAVAAALVLLPRAAGAPLVPGKVDDRLTIERETRFELATSTLARGPRPPHIRGFAGLKVQKGAAWSRAVV